MIEELIEALAVVIPMMQCFWQIVLCVAMLVSSVIVSIGLNKELHRNPFVELKEMKSNDNDQHRIESCQCQECQSGLTTFKTKAKFK
tara:strand:- start:252 stop:512 length:261 start_codon:yes stop_codon:yes gene_type:complete